METLLIVTTGLATAAAAAMGVTLVKTLREDRRRSDARVEALMALAANGETSPQPPHLPETSEPARRQIGATIERHEGERVKLPKVRGRVSTSQAREYTSPVTTDTSPVAGVSSMFTEPDTSSPWRHRAAVVVACVILLSAITLLWPRSGAESTAAPANTAAVPLELLSLTHAVEGESLNVSGVVQNPRNGILRTDVLATVFLLSQDGSFVASAHAPLDFTRLRPGDESPFVVKVASAARVARYRVSFRDSRGAVIGHVDRRSTNQVASRE